MAWSKEPLPLEVFKAVSTTEAEAEERQYRDSKQKRISKALRNGPFGPS